MGSRAGQSVSQRLLAEGVAYQMPLDIHGEDVWDDTALIRAYDEAVRTFESMEEAEGEEEEEEEEEGKKDPRHKGLDWQVGDKCQAIYSEDGYLYDAVVNRVGADGIKVTYSEYGNVETVPVEDVYPLPPPQLGLGSRVTARYSEDGHWYEGVVDYVRVQASACGVTFVPYGNFEEVPLAHVQISNTDQSQASTPSKKGKSAKRPADKAAKPSPEHKVGRAEDQRTSQHSLEALPDTSHVHGGQWPGVGGEGWAQHTHYPHYTPSSYPPWVPPPPPHPPMPYPPAAALLAALCTPPWWAQPPPPPRMAHPMAPPYMPHPADMCQCHGHPYPTQASTMPRLPGGLPGSEDDVAALLMAWYHAGYCTGRMQALREMGSQAEPGPKPAPEDDADDRSSQ